MKIFCLKTDSASKSQTENGLKAMDSFSFHSLSTPSPDNSSSEQPYISPAVLCHRSRKDWWGVGMQPVAHMCFAGWRAYNAHESMCVRAGSVWSGRFGRRKRERRDGEHLSLAPGWHWMTPHKFVKRHFVNEVVRQPLSRNWNGVKNSPRAPQKALKNADRAKGIFGYLFCKKCTQVRHRILTVNNI